MFGFWFSPSVSVSNVPEVPVSNVPISNVSDVPVPKVSSVSNVSVQVSKTPKTWSETLWECGMLSVNYIGPIVVEALKEKLKAEGKEKLTSVADTLFDKGAAEALELAKTEAKNITKDVAGEVVKTVKKDATEAFNKQIKQLTN